MDENLIQSMLDALKAYANKENWFCNAGDILDFGVMKKTAWIGTGTNGYDLAQFTLEEIEKSIRSESNPTETDLRQLSLFEDGV